MTNIRDEKIARFIIALLGVRGIGPRKASRLLDAEAESIRTAARLDAGFVEALYESSPSDAVAAVYGPLKASPSTWEELEGRAGETLRAAAEAGAHVLHPLMDSYPWRMTRHGSRPPVLYCLGSVEALNQEKAAAIVGTREPTEFGYRMARRLAQVLAEDGYAIVSGLALGCDTAGHEGALDARGVTVATLPTPAGSQVYPPQNQGLADRIVEAGGALVTEYAPGTLVHDQQLAGNLVARDEWQAALSDGVVAVETTVDGGTRHAMDHALKRGIPIAAFDYESRLGMDFRNNPQFGGNVRYIDEEGATPIFEPETVEAFKARMDALRRKPAPEAERLPGQEPLF